MKSRIVSALRPITKRYHSTASADELSHFATLAGSWWDVQGPQRILHKMNLLRMDYIRGTLKKHSAAQPGYSLDLLPESEQQRIKLQEAIPSNLSVLDVGCGGGILAESLARWRYTSAVKGIDMSPDVLQVAKEHKKLDPMLRDKLQYDLVELDNIEQSYDVVTMFEMLEHVDNPSAMMRNALDRVKAGGWIFLSTINRTPVSYFTTIFMGEDLLKIVPKGTHTWSKYINESELREWACEQSDIDFITSDGCMYVPTCGWVITPETSMGNYLMAIKKKS